MVKLRKVALAVMYFVLGTATGALGINHMLTKKYEFLDKEIYECAVGVTYLDANLCFVYAIKGFIDKNGSSSSGRRNNNKQQGEPFRPTEQALPS